ncbi:MAG TPA: hypothetical protein VLR92_05030 [Blastocatellia bacterium]|nr:hypothetical protein [Blastocatellia bacterium]
MKVMSLALSLVSAQSFNSFLQHESKSNQAPGAEETQQLQQEKKDPARSPGVINIPFKISVRPIALPPGDNAWAVQIVSRGGLTGSGRGDLTITSEGTLFWNGAEGGCSRRLNDESKKS